jgi:CRISPR/Cas system-associated protein Cas10 (large subunit of type III CRISPR-Cas system)
MAVRLTHDFLQSFAAEAKQCAFISPVVPEGLTASAGVAIIKPHFPFHLAYEISEDLLASAK